MSVCLLALAIHSGNNIGLVLLLRGECLSIIPSVSSVFGEKPQEKKALEAENHTKLWRYGPKKLFCFLLSFENKYNDWYLSRRYHHLRMIWKVKSTEGIVVLLSYSKQNGKNAILATASHKYYCSNMTHPRKCARSFRNTKKVVLSSQV